METNSQTNATILYAGRSFYVQFENAEKEDLVFTYENTSQVGTTVSALLAAINEQSINILNKDSFKFFQSAMSELSAVNESLTPEDEALLEFEMFNVTRRDVVSFADFLKNAKNASELVKSGKDLPTRKFQLGFMHEIQRDPTFKHPAFDSHYKSFGTKDKKKREEAEGGGYTTPGAYPAAVGGF